jgi:hypothetical protein
MKDETSETIKLCEGVLAEAQKAGAFVLFSDDALKPFSDLIFLRDDDADDANEAYDTIDNAV